MNSAASREFRRTATDEEQGAWARAAGRVERYVWDSQFGSVLIEVIEDKTFVNGVLVEPMRSWRA